MRYQEHGGLVYCDHIIPLLFRELSKRMTALDTGVIHQHINGADVLFDMFNGGINFMFMSNIKRCGNGLNTLLVEFFYSKFCAFGSNIINNYLCAIFTQAGCQ
ncbi:Uncharacterised protein [Klebsiella pneumoniae]|nr:Uncharacterised protein [Shigella sonnei]SWL61918.1 Uncharacterised protein [Klebsiella pneumoniae]